MNNDKWYLKKHKGNECLNYYYIKKLGLEKIVPKFQIEEKYLKLEMCESIYPHFSLDNQCLYWLYENTIRHIHNIRSSHYSLGFYKYISFNKIPAEFSAKENECLYYFKYISNFINEINDFLNIDNEEDSYLKELYTYVMEELDKYQKWLPSEGYSLLHGDFKISNMVYLNKPLLIDLEFMRYGLPEIELSNFIVQLIGMNKKSDKLIIPYATQILKEKSSFGNIDYELVKRICIPLFFYFRYVYAKAGYIGYSNVILESYPIEWRKYRKELL